jgi:hypothetical protein
VQHEHHRRETVTKHPHVLFNSCFRTEEFDRSLQKQNLLARTKIKLGGANFCVLILGDEQKNTNTTEKHLKEYQRTEILVLK